VCCLIKIPSWITENKERIEELRIFISKLHVSASSGFKEIFELEWQLGE